MLLAEHEKKEERLDIEALRDRALAKLSVAKTGDFEKLSLIASEFFHSLLGLNSLLTHEEIKEILESKALSLDLKKKLSSLLDSLLQASYHPSSKHDFEKMKKNVEHAIKEVSASQILKNIKITKSNTSLFDSLFGKKQQTLTGLEKHTTQHDILSAISKARQNLLSGNHAEAAMIYSRILKLYSILSDEEKKTVYFHITKLYEKLSGKTQLP